MTLTASDVASLKSALGWWELAEYFSTVVVFIGCIGEFFAEFTRFPKSDRSKHRVNRLSLILVIAGVAGELCATVRTSQLSGQIIAYVEANASDAKVSADNAAGAAKRAENSASDAESLASGARQEADSFERDIVSAKQQATRAESNLAGALRQAAKAQAELNLLKTPRTLRNVARFVALIKSFPGTEYTFEGVRHDDEAAHLLITIYRALQEAKWKIVPPIMRDISGRPLALAGAPAFPINDDPDDGILIVVEIPKAYGPGTPPNNLPAHVRAALSLRAAVAATLFPPEEQPRKLALHWGTSPVVQIFIGQKAP